MPKRRKYLSVRLPAKGVRPFHSDRAPSSRMMVVPQLKIPAFRVYDEQLGVWICC